MCVCFHMGIKGGKGQSSQSVLLMFEEWLGFSLILPQLDFVASGQLDVCIYTHVHTDKYYLCYIISLYWHLTVAL